MIYRILAAAVGITAALTVPGATPVAALGSVSALARFADPNQLSPPFQMAGTWNLTEHFGPAQGGGTPPLANTSVTFTGGPGCSYYANDPCYTATWADSAGQSMIVVSVFVSPRGLLLSGYRTVGSYQRSLVSRIPNDSTQPTRFTTGTWTDATGRTGTFELVPG